MKNINELIGIIKGINFDGVINDREIERLRLWTDKNRNLAYESKQAELIKLVDNVLEDNIIDDDEKITMLEFCNKVQEDLQDDMEKIYELNGLVEGIICDGEVNEPEVYRLKEWVDDNKKYIQGHDFLDVLNDLLNDILEDGIVSNEEQELLLKVLSERIKNNQFETKIEYLKKQVRARKNIGVDLIDLLDNDEAINEIHRLAERELKRTLYSYTCAIVSDPEIVFISLVLIAMLFYDGNYYDSVRRTYKDLYKMFPEQKIEGLIRSILCRYKTYETEKNSRARLINIALENAIVPSHFLQSFFDFIYDIYKLNFEYELSSDLEKDFRFVYDGLRKNMLSEGDDIKLNVTKKTYKLIKSTQKLIANTETVEAVIKLSIIVVKLIDKEIWNKELKIFNPYLKIGYDGWKNGIDKQLTRSERKLGVKRHRKPRFSLCGNDICILPTVHRISNEYDYRDISVLIEDENTQIYINESPEIKEIIGGYQINVDKIKISNPLGNVRYYIKAGKKIYDSKDVLYRKYIVFDLDGNEIKNNTDYTGMVVFCTHEEIQFNAYYNSNHYVLSSENVKLGSSYFVCDEVFNFSSFAKPGLFGKEIPRHFLAQIDGDKKIKVYSELKFLMFETDGKFDGYEIAVNGKHYDMKDYQYSIVERDGASRYILDMPIEKSDIYKIAVYGVSDNRKTRIMVDTIAIDKAFKSRTSRLDDSTYYIDVNSGLLDKDISREINIENFQVDWLRFKKHGKEYCYLIPFAFDIYRLNNGSWQPLADGIWIGDIAQGSTLDIYGYKIDELLVCSNLGQPLSAKLSLKDMDIYKRIDVGFLASFKENHDYIQLLLLCNKKIVRGMYCYNKMVIDDKQTELYYDSVTKSLDFLPVFYGKGNMYMCITNQANEVVYRSDILESEYIYTTTELPSFERLNITFFEKPRGLSLKKERVLKEYQKTFYARADFLNKSFGIKKVRYDMLTQEQSESKNYKLIETYICLTEQVSKDVFKGEVYKKSKYGTYNLKEINPVNVEICSEEMDRNVDISITKNGEDLILRNGTLSPMSSKDTTGVVYTMEIGGNKH